MKARAVFFRVANVPMRLMLRLPFTTPMSRRLMLLEHVGRKTGNRYVQPLSFVEDGDVLLTPGGGRWKLNLRPDKPVVLTLRGKRASARPELVRDPAEVERLLDLMTLRNPALKRFVPIPRLDNGRLDPSALAQALEHGFCIVRWHLA
jgi:hypothetical protein